MKIRTATTLLLALTSTSLSADCFYWEGGIRTGYRQDQHRLSVSVSDGSEALNFSEAFDQIAAFQLEGFTKFRLWWFEVGAEGDYSWIQGGNVKSTLYVEGSNSDGTPFYVPVKSKSDPEGDEWDLFAYGGLRVPFCSNCCVSFALTPLGGYSLQEQSLKRQNTGPPVKELGPVLIGTGTGVILSNPTVAQADYDKRLTRDWSGPFVGGAAELSFSSFQWRGGYSYHWLDLTQKFEVKNRLFTSTNTQATNTIGEFTFNNSNRLKKEQCPGQRAWLSVGYVTDSCWKFGLRGTYMWVDKIRGESRNENRTTFQVLTPIGALTETEETTFPQETASWQTFSALFEASFRF